MDVGDIFVVSQEKFFSSIIFILSEYQTPVNHKGIKNSTSTLKKGIGSGLESTTNVMENLKKRKIV